MARALLRVLLALCLAAGGEACAADVVVAAQRDGDVLLIEASAEFEGTVAQTWQVLTDYDNLAKFVPNLTLSRVTARSVEGITVEQKGEARLRSHDWAGALVHFEKAVDLYPEEGEYLANGYTG